MDKKKSGFYLVAGVYLVYLAYGLVKDLMNETEARNPLILVCAVVFAGLGIFLAVQAVRTLITPSAAEQNDQQEEDKQEIIAEADESAEADEQTDGTGCDERPE